MWLWWMYIVKHWAMKYDPFSVIQEQTEYLKRNIPKRDYKNIWYEKDMDNKTNNQKVTPMIDDEKRVLPMMEDNSKVKPMMVDDSRVIPMMVNDND